MQIFTSVSEIQNFLCNNYSQDSLGFVPTMGALHSGHLSLIRKAKSENALCVCSIFVNPIQFNNPDDLQKYPRTFDKDVEMLISAGCDILFFPDEDEMYPVADTTKYDFNQLDKVMEGEFRPGHFRGVAVVVRRLFEIIKPHKAYFGKKDYQQLKIVESLVKQYNLSPEIIGCDIVREEDGLAMSSRNMRLSPEQRIVAPNIYRILQAASILPSTKTVQEVKEFVADTIKAYDEMQLEYFKICDADDLIELKNWRDAADIMGFIVVNLGEIRLIDNINFIL